MTDHPMTGALTPAEEIAEARNRLDSITREMKARGCHGGHEIYQACEAGQTILAAYLALLERSAWQPIATAPTDGTEVWVYVAARDGLEAFQCVCAYHPDAGWCADELRNVTHWKPLDAPQEGGAT